MFNLKKAPNQQLPPDAERAEELRAVIGQVSWFTSFMGFVVNELFRLSPDDNNDNNNIKKPLTQSTIQSKVHTLSTPALSLLLISTSRLFLKYSCRNLRQYALEANNFRGYAGPLRDAYQTVISILRNSPVQWVQFEKMIMEVEAKTKEAYQGGGSSGGGGEAAGISDAERKNIEKEMLISGTIPSVLMPVVTTLLTSVVASLREEIDVAELYFSDFSWLDLDDYGQQEEDEAIATEPETEIKIENPINNNKPDSSRPRKKRRRMIEKPQFDSIRKVPLKQGGKIKRCVRCCALIGDTQQQPQPYATKNQALAQLLKTCLCGDQCMDPAREK